MLFILAILTAAGIPLLTALVAVIEGRPFIARPIQTRDEHWLAVGLALANTSPDGARVLLDAIVADQDEDVQALEHEGELVSTQLLRVFA